jgi:tripartite-type tricarboxylate transporter receptor subunit TctC
MNPLLNRRKAIQTSAVLASSISMPAIHAQERAPIKILMGFPPGGGTDLIARTIAERLRETLGQPVIIDPKVGVGGRLAADAMMAAPPDGMTYMIAPNATPTFQTLVFGHQIKWDVLRNWTPVAALVTYPIGMAASLQTGVTNVKQLVDWTRASVPPARGDKIIFSVKLLQSKRDLT